MIRVFPARFRAGRTLIAILLSIVWSASQASAAESVLRGLAIDQRLDEAPLPANIGAGLPLVMRLSIDGVSLTATNQMIPRLEERLALYRSRQQRVVLALGQLPAASAGGDEIERWR